MDNTTYFVADNNGCILASHMELRHALIFIQGLMMEFYNEPMLSYRIEREQSCECEQRTDYDKYR